MRFFVAVNLWLNLILLVFSGCATSPVSNAKPIDQEIVFIHGDGRVGTYVSQPWGFRTSSYWIEGRDGLILIDTQFMPSATEEMIQWVEKFTGKKIVLAVVLHPNPDKFNGTAVLQKHGVRVITSEQVLKLIPEVHQDRLASFYERYKPDYPLETPKPESFGDSTREISAGGTTIKLHVLGEGASGAHVVAEYDGHLFVGDLVANDSHSWLELGKTDEWLKRIDEMRALHPRFVHPGRGSSGGPELLDREEAYLKTVIRLVAAEHPRALPEEQMDAAIARIKEKLMRLYPGYFYSVFLNIGLPAEWERQVRVKS